MSRVSPVVRGSENWGRVGVIPSGSAGHTRCTRSWERRNTTRGFNLLLLCVAFGWSTDPTVTVTINPTSATIMGGRARSFECTVRVDDDVTTNRSESTWSLVEGAQGGSLVADPDSSTL